VAIFNHKGGTAKTTTAVNVAAGLAARGQRVLLVDTDGQGNVGVSLKLEFERSLYHVIVMGLDYREAVVQTRPGLDVLPANETLAAAELYLSGRQNRDRVLRDRLREARDAYDFVILDCSPSLSLMNQNALVTSDALLCPVACDYLALVGVRQVLRTLRHVNQFLRHPLELFGVLPTLFDPRVRICQEAHEALREHFKSRCLNPIRQSSKLKEAPSAGKPLREYAPQSPAMADYEAVVEQLITHNRSAMRVGLRAGGVA
jgi:chromosome partitioning protein